jgi:hypothetical protein
MLTANGRGSPGLSDLLTPSRSAQHDSPTLVGLERRIASAHAIYQRGEYQHVADGLPALIGCTTNGTLLAEDERSRQHVLAAQGWSFVLAAKLATKFDDASAARLAADRGDHGRNLQRLSGLAGGSHLPVGLRPGGWRRTRSRRTGCCHRCRPPGRGERPRPLPHLCSGRPAADRRNGRVRSGRSSGIGPVSRRCPAPRRAPWHGLQPRVDRVRTDERPHPCAGCRGASRPAGPRRGDRQSDRHRQLRSGSRRPPLPGSC